MNIEEEIADAISGIQVGSGYYATAIGIDAAQEVAQTLMPLVKRSQAEALRDAVRDFENEVGVEEFDNISARPGRHGLVRWVGIEEAWENQGPFMDWLRNRADRIESEVSGV